MLGRGPTALREMSESEMDLRTTSDRVLADTRTIVDLE